MVELPNPTIQAIYASYERAEKQTPRRTHLGASIIGKPCAREIWYSFRWAKKENFDGRMLRLFQTGHKAEDRLVEDLQRAGVSVSQFDPQTGRQYRFEMLGGHFSGSCDGIGHGFPEAPSTQHLLEFKTSNDKRFKELKSAGVFVAKPEHFWQMQVYMHAFKLTRAFYLCVNKNTDELYQERLAYDREGATRIIKRAERIINSETPPPKHFEKESQCWFCPFKNLCWQGETAERNCRTCAHSSICTKSGSWFCDQPFCAEHGECHDKECEHKNFDPLTPQDQANGCSSHLYRHELVGGTLVDAGSTWAEYHMPDGKVFKDGV